MMELATGIRETAVCPVCHHQDCMQTLHIIDQRGIEADQYYQYECPRCGKFRATYQFAAYFIGDTPPLGPAGSRARANLSGWLRENERINVLLTSHTFKPGTDDQAGSLVRDLIEPSFHQKADKLLLAFEREIESADESIETIYFPEKWVASAWAKSKEEFDVIVEFLVSSGRVHTESQRINSQPDYITIRPDGWAHLEQLHYELPNSDQIFVAMWFEDEIRFLYDSAIKPGIEAAGYRPVIISDWPHGERIDDRIEVEIKNSHAIVADFTGHRGGVYFEAGLARGQGKPVIWLCHKDDFDELHFDIRQFNCLRWTCDSIDKLAEDIQFAIENLCGPGPLKQKS